MGIEGVIQPDGIRGVWLEGWKNGKKKQSLTSAMNQYISVCLVAYTIVVVFWAHFSSFLLGVSLPLAKTSTLSWNFVEKAFPFRFPIWVSSRDSSENVQHEHFWWDALYKSSSFLDWPKQGAPFSIAGSPKSDSYRTGFVRKSITLRWNKHLHISLIFCISLFFGIFSHTVFWEFSPRKLGKMNPFWRPYFLRWVGSTTN